MIIVFRGHGGKRGTILTSDQEALSIRELHDLVSATDFDKRIEDIPRIFIIDACRGKTKLSTKEEETKEKQGNKLVPSGTGKETKKQRNKLVTIYGAPDGYVTYARTTEDKGLPKGGFLSTAILRVLNENVSCNEQFGRLGANMSFQLKQIESEQLAVIEGDAVLNRLWIKPNKKPPEPTLVQEISQVKNWMETLLGVEYDVFYDAMVSSNGVQLCQLLNVIKPKTCQGMRISSQRQDRHKNVEIFRQGCVKLGVDERFCMRVDALDSSDNIVDVLINLYAVSAHVAASNEIEFKSGIENCEEILYTNTKKYIGCVHKHNKKSPQGYGKMIWTGPKSSKTYTGKWENYSENGWGSLEKKTESELLIYEGEFTCGHFSGKGTMKTGNDEFYDGYFAYGACETYKFHGSGKLVFQDNAVYEGNWENGKANGYGSFQLATGELYEGPWIRGKLDLGVVKYDSTTEHQWLELETEKTSDFAWNIWCEYY